MAYQIMRAIVKGTIGGVIETRNVFTANVDVVSPEGATDVWTQYLNGIYNPVISLLSPIFSTYLYQVDYYMAGKWEPIFEEPYVKVGSAAGEAIANLVAFVLIGKGLGRRKMGRKFFSPTTEAHVLGNTLIPAALITAGNVLVAYITPITTAGGSALTPGILDKTGSFQFFSTGFVSALLGTIRRRKPNVGI